MSIEDILAAYEAARRLKEENERLENEAKQKAVEDNRLRRIGNAREVETHLLEVVSPVLSNAERKIKASGWQCRLETVLVHDPLFEAKDPCFALRLHFLAGNFGTKLAVLEYEGQFASVTMRKRETFPGEQRPPKIVNLDDPPDDGFRPLNHFTAEIIQGQVEAFVTEALKP
jgi:hypothetical protein